MFLITPLPDWVQHTLIATFSVLGTALVAFIVWLVKRWIARKDKKEDEAEKAKEDHYKEQIKINAERIDELEKELTDLRLKILEELFKRLTK